MNHQDLTISTIVESANERVDAPLETAASLPPACHPTCRPAYDGHGAALPCPVRQRPLGLSRS
jgi:hypothetical protein